MSEIYTEDNLLDRLSDPATLAAQYERGKRRERELLDRHLELGGGDAISIGCGWHPGRHLLPAPQWRLVAADIDPRRPRFALSRRAPPTRGCRARPARLDMLPDCVVRRRPAPPRPAPCRLPTARSTPASDRGAAAAAPRRRARRDRAQPVPSGRRRARARQPRRPRRARARHARRHPAVAAAADRRRARRGPASRGCTPSATRGGACRCARSGPSARSTVSARRPACAGPGAQAHADRAAPPPLSGGVGARRASRSGSAR